VRRLRLPLAVVAAAVTAGAAAASGGLLWSAQGQSGWDVPVAGCETPLRVKLSFNSRTHADGSVGGSYVYRNTCRHSELEDGIAKGPIVCAAVSGSRAWFGGLVEETNVPLWVGREMWFQVIDGSPDSSTLIGTSPVAGSAQAYCAARPDPLRWWTVERGGLDVRSP
jgi:hypothetical protein